MSTRSSGLIRLESNPDQALKDLLRGGEEAQEVRLAIRANPSSALQILTNDNSTLTQKGRADVLDEILPEFSVAEARELLSEHFLPEQLAEVIAGRGDLPSSSILIVPMNDAIAAMLHDVQSYSQEENTDGDNLINEGAFILLRAWAYNLQDRNDWDQILKTQVIPKTTMGKGPFSLSDVLMLITLRQYPRTDIREIPGDIFEEMGINPLDAYERLQELKDEAGIPKLSTALLEKARMRLHKRKMKLEAAPQIKEQVQEAAKQAAQEVEDL